jgi:hypothetical protein
MKRRTSRDVFLSSGTDVTEWWDGQIDTYYYESQSRVVKESSIAVPAGTFDAVKLKVSISWYAYQGGPLVYRSDQNSFLAPGLGLIRDGVDGVVDRQLSETNRAYLPEPGLTALSLSAFAMLLLLRRVKFRSTC